MPAGLPASCARRAALLALLAALASCSPRGPGKDLLPPPRNVALVSKDFSLFLTWLPSMGYPPGVSYTVQWTNVYHDGWKDFLPCRNISDTVCNITCLSPDQYHSFDVRVKAQAKAGTVSSIWVDWPDIDYAVEVKLTPPVLHVQKTGHTVTVKTTFSDPSCLKSLFWDLTSDLEFWEAGTSNRKRFNMNATKDFDATVFNGSHYCFRARANLNGRPSNFSEPTCIPLHKEAEDTWAFAALSLPLLLILGCMIRFFHPSRFRPKTVKSPQALDFSNYGGPKKFLEFAEKEVTCIATCTEHPLILQNSSRHTPQMHSPLVPSVLEEEEEEDEEEEDIDSPRIYTEVHRFQRDSTDGQVVGLGEKKPGSSSESGNSQLSGGSVLDLRKPEVLVSVKPAFGEMISGFQGSESSSASSSSEESSVCQGIYPATPRRPEGSDEDTDFLFPLPDPHLPTGKLFRTSERFCEASCKTLQDPQISLLGPQNNQAFFSFLLEGKKLSEEGSWGSGRLVVNFPPLTVTPRESLESLLGKNEDLVEDTAPEPKCHGYRPRPVHYLSRSIQEFH